MEFDHEQLDVYKASLNFAELATKLIEAFPTGKSHLSDQFKRAFVSISKSVRWGKPMPLWLKY